MPFGISLDSAASFLLVRPGFVASFAYLMMTIFVSSSFGSSLKGVRDQPRPDGCAGFQSVDDPMDHIRLCRLLGRCFPGCSMSTTINISTRPHSRPRALLKHCSALLPEDRETPGGPVVGAALVLLLKNYASAYIERWKHAAGPGVPVYRSRSADRNRSRLEQAWRRDCAGGSR